MNTKARTLDLLRKISGVLVTPPEPLPKSSNTQQRILQHVEGIARRLFILPQLPSTMATVTFSIGSTGRDYSTIAAWEADLDNSGLYSAADDAVGECYNDSAFDEYLLVNGGGTIGLGSVSLTVAAGEAHDGTAGSGARIVNTSSGDHSFGGDSLSLLEIDGNGVSTGSAWFNSAAAISDNANYQRVIFHSGSTTTTSGDRPPVAIKQADTTIVTNCIFYDMESAAPGQSGVVIGSASRGYSVHNNTFHDIRNTHATADHTAVEDSGVNGFSNNISTSASTTGTGTAFDFDAFTMSYCLSSDTSATGTGSLTSKSAANQFVSVVSGSEDLHLKTGADAIDAGADLGTTPTGVNIDIDGRDRDAEGDTWDIGADEFVAAGGGTSTATAGLVLAAAIAAGSASFTAPGPFTASAALLSPPAIVDAAGTTSVPNRNATADLIASAAIADASGTVENPVFSATAALQSPSVLAAGSASFADAIFSATAGLATPPATAAGNATFSPPEFTASAALSVGSVAASGTATFATSLFQSTAALHVPASIADGSASFVAPSYSGSATLIVAAPIVDASSSEFNVSDYYYQFLLGSGA